MRKRKVSPEVIKAAAQGDAAAFTEIYEKFRPMIFALALRMSANVGDAEDLTQDIFIQLMRKIGTFQGRSAFSTWLWRVAVNEVLMRRRAKREKIFRSSVSMEQALFSVQEEEKFQAIPKEVLKAISYHDRNLEKVVEKIILRRAIESLPPGYKSVVTLHYLQDMTHAEIAATLGSSMGNSKSQLNKALASLRKKILSGNITPSKRGPKVGSHRKVKPKVPVNMTPALLT